MMGAILSGGTPSASLLMVGSPTDSLQANVLFGDSAISGYILNQIKMYAADVIIEGNGNAFAGQTTLRAKNGGTALIEAVGIGGTVRLNAVGSIVGTAQAGSVSFTALVGGILLDNLDSANRITAQSEGDVLIKAINPGKVLALQSDLVELAKSTSMQYWLRTRPNSYFYNQVATVQTGVPSIQMEEDIVMVAGRSIVSLDTHLQIGPNLDIGAGRIITTQPALSLMSGSFVAGESVSLEARIHNDAALPVNQTFNNGTFIDDGHMLFDDADGYRFAGGAVVFDGPRVHVTGDLIVDGSFSALVCLACASDATVKSNIQKILPYDSFKRVLRLKPVSYTFNKDFQQKNSFVGDGSYHGFLAQDVLEDFPWAVKRRRAFGMEDFHELHRDMLIPDLVNAFRYLVHRVERLEKQLKKKKNKERRRF